MECYPRGAVEAVEDGDLGWVFSLMEGLGGECGMGRYLVGDHGGSHAGWVVCCLVGGGDKVHVC